jgi:hypothetical protein
MSTIPDDSAQPETLSVTDALRRLESRSTQAYDTLRAEGLEPQFGSATMFLGLPPEGGKCDYITVRYEPIKGLDTGMWTYHFRGVNGAGQFTNRDLALFAMQQRLRRHIAEVS